VLAEPAIMGMTRDAGAESARDRHRREQTPDQAAVAQW
jgi:hypothetical protein